MLEDELHDQIVLAAASIGGWRIYSIRDSRKVLRGLHPEGFPDLVLAGGSAGRILFRELKTERGKLRPDQEFWRDHLLSSGADWKLWRPSDWPEIERTLRGGA